MFSSAALLSGAARIAVTLALVGLPVADCIAATATPQATAPRKAPPDVAQRCVGAMPTGPAMRAEAFPHPAPAEIKATALAFHNRERALVGVEPMIWDDEVAKGAQYWASMIIKTGVNKHDPDSHGGESIAGGPDGAKWSIEDLMGGWAAEKYWFTNIAFPGAVAACNAQTGEGPGHYYGLVRRAARRVGCGVGSKGTYRVVVCRYDPGYAPPGELAWPTSAKPWPALEPVLPNQTPWVESARFDLDAFKANMLKVNVAHRAGLTWDDTLANTANWDAILRMRADTPWARTPDGPAASADEIVHVAMHGPTADITDYPEPDIMMRDLFVHRAEAKAKLTGSAWTRVGCGTAIRPAGTANKRLVICRYS